MSDRVKWHQRLHFNCSSITTGNSDWDRNAGDELVAGICTWETAAGLIRGLNGRHMTEVFIGDPGDECVDRQLSVSDGKTGRYLVAVQLPGRYFYLARQTRGAEPEGLDEVVVGGLPAFYPACHIQPLKAVLFAAEYYFQTGCRARKLTWMRGDVAERLRREAEDEYWRVRG